MGNVGPWVRRNQWLGCVDTVLALCGLRKETARGQHSLPEMPISGSIFAFLNGEDGLWHRAELCCDWT